MRIAVTAELIAQLHARGIECFLRPGAATLPRETVLEPPCSLKWMAVDYSLRLGAFSYAVSGYFFGATIGRYSSIGEMVQVGRGDHPTGWLSTSPAFYLHEPLFAVGEGFAAAADYHAHRPQLPPGAQATVFKPTTIGNDVWIGHGAYVRAGVSIGDGAIVGAHAVVVRDVPPYAVVAGNPAVIRRFRLPPELIGAMLSLRWWRFAPWQLRGIDVTDPRAAVGAIERLAATVAPFAPDLVSLAGPG